MTTIVFRDGILAADGRITQNETIVGDNFTKIHVLADGGAVAMCGRPDECVPIIEWLKAVAAGEQAGPQPDVESSTLLHINGDGVVRLLNDRHWIEIDEPFIAAGSGSSAALGALHAGASAIEAVTAAIKTDPYSGGQVRAVTLEHLVPRKTRKPKPANS